jgi:starch-binding outer membrane protein, SusD/RagB family
MRTLRGSLVGIVLALSLTGCLDEHLTTQPQTILTDDQIWTQPRLISNVLADFYARLPETAGLETGQWEDMAAYDEAVYSGIGLVAQGENRNTRSEIPFGWYSLWGGNSGYGLIRDINLAMDNITAASSPTLTAAIKEGFLAELRFLRAWVYFELVKRMGGVPIVTEQMIYDFSGDPSYLQMPRNREAEVYDFIASELDAIAGSLGNEGSTWRANRFTALALKSRAMLYAGSLARHNNEMSNPIVLAGGEVGIPASRAAEYYQKSLDASRAILTSGRYSLYRRNPQLGQNFHEAITNRQGNPEMIFAKHYSAAAGVNHIFTIDAVLPPSLRMENVANRLGGALSPSRNLVEAFDYLDGSPGTLRGVGTGSNTAAGQASWIFYDDPLAIFAGKDWRLHGTVVLPGTELRGGQVRLQAGVYAWNAAANKYDRVEGERGSTFTDGGVLTSFDGPVRTEAYISATGFYIRKFADPNPQAGTSSHRSDVWWPRFRLGEIYLNAAEAALELGLQPEAVGYVNIVRERAGFAPNSLATLTRATLRNERRVELAFEDHRYWDLVRWRIAHEVWDGQPNSPTAHNWTLFPYRVVRPGHPTHNKWVFDSQPAARQLSPRFFRLGNYYSEVPSGVVGNNPKIVRNPFH